MAQYGLPLGAGHGQAFEQPLLVLPQVHLPLTTTPAQSQPAVQPAGAPVVVPVVVDAQSQVVVVVVLVYAPHWGSTVVTPAAQCV